MRMQTAVIMTAASMAVAGAAQAAITVDGTLDTDYGSALTVQTQASNYSKEAATNAQLAALYGRVDGGNLYVFIAGAVAPNDGCVNLFVQSKAGGVANLAGQAAGLNLGGVSFDAGFAPNYNLKVNGPGWDSARYWKIYDLNAATVADAAWIDSWVGPKHEYVTAGNGLGVTFANNYDASASLIAPAAAAGIQTGLEVKLSLADLGYTSGDIKVMAMLTQGNQNEGTNQNLAPYVPQDPEGTNYWTYRYTNNFHFWDDSAFAGDQFVIVPVPEPAGIGALGLGLMLAMKRRRSL